MEKLEYVQGHFYLFKVKSKVLCKLLGRNKLFSVLDDELSFGWSIGAKERDNNKDEISLVEQCSNFEDFDLCKYLIILFERYQTVGFIDCIEWFKKAVPSVFRNNLYYDENEGEIYKSQSVKDVITKLRCYYDEINDSVEKFCIIEYDLNGNRRSKLNVITLFNGRYTHHLYDESEINEITESFSFFDDLISGDFDFDYLLERILFYHYGLAL